MGASNSVAKVSRSAAITSEGASACARRIKIEAVETARIAIKIAAMTLAPPIFPGSAGEGSFVILGF
jgi:hypothetical protein